MEPNQLASLVKAHLDEHAPSYGLNGSDVAVEYRYYGGSFERRHFAISDGTAAYHLKLARTPDHLARLRKWFSLRELLHDKHRAPRIVAWVDVPGSDFSGLLCDHVHGRVWEYGARPDLAPNVIALVQRLHEDLELKSALRRLTPAGDCRDYYNGVWRRRIRRDLKVIKAQLPAFVAAEALRWMREEGLRIEAEIGGMQAFSHPADSPVHGDLWPGNILVTDDGQVRIVDWDDLALGDPALEYAVLLDPVIGPEPRASLQELLPFEPDEAFIQRFEMCLRAQRLYVPIEAAAEYIEAAEAGAAHDGLRDEKEALHRDGLRAYTWRYGAGGRQL